jgi:hypothetical protein
MRKSGRARREAQFDVDEVREWRAARERTARERGPLDPVNERALRDRAQRELMEQTYRTRAGQLLDAAAVERVWSLEYAAIRQLLLAIPNAYADQIYAVAVSEGVPGVVRLLGEMVHAVLTEISDPTRPPVPPREGQAA